MLERLPVEAVSDVLSFGVLNIDVVAILFTGRLVILFFILDPDRRVILGSGTVFEVTEACVLFKLEGSTLSLIDRKRLVETSAEGGENTRVKKLDQFDCCSVFVLGLSEDSLFAFAAVVFNSREDELLAAIITGSALSFDALRSRT